MYAGLLCLLNSVNTKSLFASEKFHYSQSVCVVTIETQCECVMMCDACIPDSQSGQSGYFTNTDFVSIPVVLDQSLLTLRSQV